MPRTARASVGGVWYHALNRGNGRAEVFHKAGDYEAFVEAMIDARARLPIDILGYCLMPNHIHIVLRPRAEGELGRWMQWLLMAHARRYHKHYGTSGHVWQGRFKAFPIQDDDHLATVLRYVERNPLRAKLVTRAEGWKWSSLPAWQRRETWLWPGKPPVRSRNWLARVQEPLSASDLLALRQSAERGRPYGDDPWTKRTVKRLGLEHTMRTRGRPRKESE
jgi:REP-associated tyrosine transposase